LSKKEFNSLSSVRFLQLREEARAYWKYHIVESLMVIYESIEARHRRYSCRHGALLIADGVIDAVTGTFVFFPDVHSTFKFIVGFIALVSATASIVKKQGITNTQI